jgi:hypothetical protein
MTYLEREATEKAATCRKFKQLVPTVPCGMPRIDLVQTTVHQFVGMVVDAVDPAVHT